MSTEQRSINLFDDSTIVAIATANGIGLFQLLEFQEQKLLKLLLKFLKNNFQPRLQNTFLFIWFKNNEIIDESLVLYFKAPFSFTGEDVVEFQCHGGVAIANMIVDEVLKNGARLANPENFQKSIF